MQKKSQKQNKKQKLKSFKTALITGASSGIGAASALALARAGYALILTARRLPKLKKLKKRCEQAGSPEVYVESLDVQKQPQVRDFALALKKKKLRLDVLVNNAGLAKGVEAFQYSDIQDVDVMLDTNVKGLLYVTREVLPLLIQSGGHIVNMGSVAGRLVYEGGTVYCATKFAVRAISDALRLDLKGTGVRVTNIEPGMVQTEFSIIRLGNQQKAAAVYEDMMPLTAMDIAETILWCLSRPRHVNISELVIYPTDQASVGHVVRGEKSTARLFKSS